MSKLLSFATIANVTNGTWQQSPVNLQEKLQGASFDSRNLENEDIFFAFKNATPFLSQLNGTSVKLLVIDEDFDGVLENLAVLKVENALVALQQK